jgi:hypothetical protein
MPYDEERGADIINECGFDIPRIGGRKDTHK